MYTKSWEFKSYDVAISRFDKKSNLIYDYFIGYDIDYDDNYYMFHCKDCGTKLRLNLKEYRSKCKTNWCTCKNNGEILDNTYRSIRVIEKRHNYSKYYKCECLICGNIRYLDEDKIKLGYMEDCDCTLPSLFVEDLSYLGYNTGFEQTEVYIPKVAIQIGNIYGKLQVLDRDHTKKKPYYFCRCLNCNGIVSLRTDHVKHGSTNRCNCGLYKRVTDIAPETPIEFS